MRAAEPLDVAHGAHHPAADGERWIALIGNPNTGKTTLFNALTGVWARTGNYPGVTVDKRVGTLRANVRERAPRRSGSWICPAPTASPPARPTRWSPSTCSWAGVPTRSDPRA